MINSKTKTRDFHGKAARGRKYNYAILAEILDERWRSRLELTKTVHLCQNEISWFLGFLVREGIAEHKHIVTHGVKATFFRRKP